MYAVSRRTLLGAVAGAVGVGVASGLGRLPGAAASETRRPAEVPLRGHLTGLLQRTNAKIPECRSKITGFVHNLKWADAQLNPGEAISQEALNGLQAAVNLATESGLNLKLRIFAGRYAPDWAKDLGGGRLVGWHDPEDGDTADVPRWWHPSFLAAYDDFLQKLAPHLSAPRWREVTVSATCTMYAEPCMRQFKDPNNCTLALAAGYDPVTDEQAFRDAITIHHRILTPLGIASSVAYNSWQMIDSTGQPVHSPQKAMELMDFQRSHMGSAGVWQNNSLCAGYVNGELEHKRPELAALYQHMVDGAAQGHPVQWQTATLKKMEKMGGTPLATARWVAKNGTLSVEMPAGWERVEPPYITQDQADTLNRRMARNDRS